MDKTIVYFTDNAMDERLADACRKWLVKTSCGLPIISVSQRPIDFGENICVGDMVRCPKSMYYQLLEGLKRVKTKWVQVAEHDCIYSEEHTRWIPPDDKFFYYNNNVWMMQYHDPKNPEYDGLFSHRRSRRLQSQIICGTEIYIESVTELLELLEVEFWNGRLAEPGTADEVKVLAAATRPSIAHSYDKVKHYLEAYQARDWKTDIPSIDIRHGRNLTGPRRGSYRNNRLEPWGTMGDILGYE